MNEEILDPMNEETGTARAYGLRLLAMGQRADESLMRLTHFGRQPAAAWRVLVFIVLLAVPAYVISDSYSDAAGVDDEAAFDVPDEDVIIGRQPIESHAQVFFRWDLPMAMEFRLPALTGDLFAWSQPIPTLPRRSELPLRYSRALPRAALVASSRTPTVDPAS